MIICLAFFGGFLLGGMIAGAIAYFYFKRGYSYVEIHDDLGELGTELIRAKNDGHTSFSIDIVDADCCVAIIDPRVKYLERLIK